MSSSCAFPDGLSWGHLHNGAREHIRNAKAIQAWRPPARDSPQQKRLHIAARRHLIGSSYSAIIATLRRCCHRYFGAQERRSRPHLRCPHRPNHPPYSRTPTKGKCPFPALPFPSSRIFRTEVSELAQSPIGREGSLEAPHPFPGPYESRTRAYSGDASRPWSLDPRQFWPGGPARP
jgi:hypothetical protein